LIQGTSPKFEGWKGQRPLFEQELWLQFVRCPRSLPAKRWTLQHPAIKPENLEIGNVNNGTEKTESWRNRNRRDGYLPSIIAKSEAAGPADQFLL
jgi:hypothetical protein